MGLIRKALHREPEPEVVCPRCGIPAPPDTTECAACGWDMNQAYNAAFTGSHIQEPETAATED